jgi:multiple sugar transport system permease protein
MRSPLRRREALEGALCILPWALGFLLFTAGPILFSLYLSFTKYEVLTPPSFIGIDNYKTMVADELFWQSLVVTAIYVVGAVPLGVIVGYVLALVLNQKVAGLSFWRTAFYMPAIIPSLAIAYLFAWMFNGELGLINAGLGFFGIKGPGWFGSREWVLPAFILMHMWAAGGGLVLYLSALQSVPTALYDAAVVDGANSLQKFWHVTLPMTSPVILFTFLTGLIGSFQVFTAAYAVTQGGPANGSLFYVLYLYRNGWNYFKMGYAAALAWILFIILLALTLVTLRVSGRLVYYAGEEIS